MYKLEELTGKQRKVGAEAPSARVFTSESDEMIIGMMAENVQLLVSLYSLNDENSLKILNTLESKFKDTKKLNLIVVVNNSFEDIEKCKATNSISKTVIAQDKNGAFAKKFGVGLEGDTYSENLGNGFFVIDKESELKAVDYTVSLEDSKLEDLVEVTTETINFKQKGHTHENWMGV